MTTVEQRKYFLMAEFTGVDPDFDDEESDVALMLHEVALTGRIELHPDGNRMSADFDPVPLHTRVYNSGTIAELKIREWAQHLEDLKRWRKEAEEFEAERRARYQSSGIETYIAEVLDPLERVLVNMRRDKPVPAGQGRVFENHVMVNESDLVKWNEDRTRKALAEVWRGDGLVIFKLR